jgi:GT2 family glycosyltransferase
VTITVVTPWFNRRAEFERDYWAAMRVADVEVLVIDNGSEPPLPNAWRLPFNSGFSHACNVGLELARTDAVLFLNNDVAATEPGWDAPIKAALEPGVLVGANLRYDRHGAVDGRALPYLDGWCLAGMREDLLELGGFDESFEEPSYYSDNDLCLRARANGMALRQVNVGVRHKLNGTARRDDPVTVRATLANRERYVSRARELLAVSA